MVAVRYKPDNRFPKNQTAVFYHVNNFNPKIIHVRPKEMVSFVFYLFQTNLVLKQEQKNVAMAMSSVIQLSLNLGKTSLHMHKNLALQDGELAQSHSQQHTYKPTGESDNTWAKTYWTHYQYMGTNLLDTMSRQQQKPLDTVSRYGHKHIIRKG